MVEQAIAANKWDRVFAICDKKVLIPTYKELFDRIPDNQKYSIFVTLYVRSETGFELFGDDFIKKVYSYKTLDPEYAERMAEFDRDSKKSMTPDGKIKVLHGQNGNYDVMDEMSWTLSRKTALFFANRFNAKGRVVSRLITRDEVQDYYNIRNEFEVIIFPDRFKT